MPKEQRLVRCSFWLGVSPWVEVPFDYMRKWFSGFNRFSGFKGGGAAHKKEAPQSINNGDAMSWHSSHQSLETPNP